MAVGDGSEAVEDMTALVDLTEQSILRNLGARYEKQLIYTYTGSILVALNPYKFLPLYDKDNIKAHMGVRMNEKPPHIFAISEAAISNCRTFKQNQAVIISGESGAGKTESTKVILQYLTVVSSQGDDSKSWIEQQILEANTVLESLGNAKTVRNNNSSRFGKFVQVLFNSSCSIIGATIVNYLLEKSRVVRQAKSERNYHVFYELVAGASADEKTKFKLNDKFESYYYLNQSGCLDIPGVNDKKHFEDLKLALTVLKMNREDLDVTFKIISAILHLGNVNFLFDESKDCVKLAANDASTVATIAELLQVDPAALISALLHRKLTVRNESTLVPLKKDPANDNRDSIAKTIYDKLFNYMVDFINTSTATSETPANFIGVLDIFGFELFEFNSFEQLCINYTNEKLQQFFNQFIFKLEQEEYKREAINFQSVDYKDNQPCLDLIEAKGGVLSMLDEECRVPKGTDDTFVNKLHDTNAKNEYYVKPRTAKGCFGIKHYAGEVIYHTVAFLDKNRDAIQDEIYDLFTASKFTLLQKLFKRVDAGKEPSGGAKKGPSTAGASFKSQLASLVTTLAATTPHYVRCIKPNWEKKAFVFDDTLVIAQLRYSGMLETIRIRKSGYAMRLPYESFNERYRFLTNGAKGDPKSIAGAIMKTAGLDPALWQLGKTKAFMKQEASNVLTDKNDVIRAKFLVTVQKIVRGHLCRRRFVKIKKSAVFLQKYLKMFVYRQKYKKMRKASIKVQAVIRGWFARDYYKSLKAEKLAAEEAERKAKAEAERARIEAERASMNAAEAAAADARLKVLAEQEKVSNAKAALEEQNLASYAAKVQEQQENKQDKTADGLDDLFSFLGDVDGVKKAGKSAGIAAQTSEFDDIFNMDNAPSPIKLKQTLGVPPAPGIENNIASKAIGQIKPPPSPGGIPRASVAALNKPKVMRANPLAKKLEAGSTVKAKEEKEDKEDYSFKIYGEKQFEKHIKNSGTFSSLRKKDILGVEEMLVYSKAPLPTSMTRFTLGNEKFVDMAVDHWKVMAKFLETSSKKPEEGLVLMRKLVENGLRFPDLRDEIYVQLCRQLNPGPSPPKGYEEIEANGWFLMAVYCGTFAPSKLFTKYLLHFISQAATPAKGIPETKPPHVKAYAQYSETVLRKINIGGARKLFPSPLELSAIRSQRGIVCQFYTMDQREITVEVFSTTTANEMVKEMAQKVNLKEFAGWALYEVHEGPWEECMIKGSEYLADIISFWSRDLGSSKSATSVSVKKSTKSLVPPTDLADTGSKIYMKKRIFRNVNDIPVDPIEFNLLYAQATNDVSHDVYPMNDKVALQFASLKAQVDGNYDPGQKNRFNDLKFYIPSSILSNQTADQWVKAIIENMVKVQGKNSIQARLLYLEALKQFKYYGSTLFAVKFKGFWPHPENVVLAIASSGVNILLKNKTFIDSFTFMEIQSWEVDNDIISISVIRKATAGKPTEKAEVFKFQNRMAEDIGNLMKEYSPKIGIDKRKDRDTFVTEAEVNIYVKDLEKARINLLKKNVILVPSSGPPKQDLSSMFAQQAKVGKSTVALPPTVQPVQATNATSTDAKSLDWPTIMSRLTYPMLASVLGKPDLVSGVALIHNLLAEMVQAASMPSFDNTQIVVVPIQTIMQKTNDLHPIIDEVYLQLLKQTTDDYPDPAGCSRVQGWRTMAVLCGLFKPNLHEVLELVRAHFKRFGVIDARLAPNPLKKQEAMFAKYCYKSLQKTQMSEKGRLMTPSQDEINFAVKMSQIYSRFYTPDNQFRAINFDPWTTAEEIVYTLKDRMQMENVEGLALYAVDENLGAQSYILPKEKICDILGKWDSQKKNVGARNTFKFLFKKRMFLNAWEISSNANEERFTLLQVLESIHAQKIPLTSDDALYLVALLAQMEHGDFTTEKNIQYKDLLEKSVPKNLINETMSRMVSSEHGSLRGKTALDCQRMFLQRIRSWKLFGSTIYEVKQSYSSALPTDCWLAIHQDGVHIMEAGSKTPTMSYTYKQLSTYLPADDSIMIVAEDESQLIRHVLETKEAHQIVALMRDYHELSQPGLKNSSSKAHVKSMQLA